MGVEACCWPAVDIPGVLGVLGVLLCRDTLLLLLLLLLWPGLGRGADELLLFEYSKSLATGMVAVMAFTRAGLDRSPAVTGVKVPESVPAFKFITPA